MKKKIFTEQQIVEVIKKIDLNLQSGDSINVARKKACANDFGSMLVKKIMRHPAYVFILNEYMGRINKNYRYKLVDGRLEAFRP